MRQNVRLLALAVAGLVCAEAVDAQQLYWVQASYPSPNIRMMDIDGKGLTTSSVGPGTLPHGLALNGILSRLFWASGVYEGAHLFSASQTFSRFDTLPNGEGESSFQGVALDTLGGKVYWTTSRISEGCSVRRANLDGTGEETLVSYPPNAPQNLRGIALDVDANTMYWADFGTGVISRSALNGSNPENFLTGLAGPVGIALDVAGGRIFWSEANSHAIRRATLDGTTTTTLVSGLGSPQYLVIDPKDSLMVWTELGGNGHGKIKKANLSGSNPVTLLGDQPADSVSYPTGIAMRGSGMPTGVADVPVPHTFALEQNYPNPFNPSTIIRYTIAGDRAQGPGNSEVRLEVYDVLGRAVAVLVNEKQTSGTHEVRFDGSQLSSGVYFYRLSEGNSIASRPMILLK